LAGLAAVLLGLIVAAGDAMAVELVPVTYAEIEGWSADSHAAAFAAFRRGCARLREPGHDGQHAPIGPACEAALAMPSGIDDGAARRFFEERFMPHRLAAGGSERGLFTGYYEPVIRARQKAGAGFAVPVLGPPPGLATVDAALAAAGAPAGFSHVLRRNGDFAVLPTRAEIEAGALDGQAPPIAWLADPVDAFFLHVQGSGRLVYGDGGSERITYAGKNGHPYTSIGRLLTERGIMRQDQVTMDSLRDWLAADPARGRALMAENRSYIFFRRARDDDPDLGPLGQLEVALTPGRSLAVDLAHHASNQPIWLDTRLPDQPAGPGGRLRRLMIAQDTGSAIRGPIRGDIFFGTGDSAGAVAGRMRAAGTMIVLVPRCAAC
jgi:membrane-bound lytic murein transglycosylase A